MKIGRLWMFNRVATWNDPVRWRLVLYGFLMICFAALSITWSVLAPVPRDINNTLFIAKLSAMNTALDHLSLEECKNETLSKFSGGFHVLASWGFVYWPYHEEFRNCFENYVVTQSGKSLESLIRNEKETSVLLDIDCDLSTLKDKEDPWCKQIKYYAMNRGRYAVKGLGH